MTGAINQNIELSEIFIIKTFIAQKWFILLGFFLSTTISPSVLTLFQSIS